MQVVIVYRNANGSKSTCTIHRESIGHALAVASIRGLINSSQIITVNGRPYADVAKEAAQ